jgi:hypothetical protein
MLPNILHLVPGKHVQIINPPDRELTLQDKTMVNAKRQHESVQENLFRSNLRRLNQQASGPQPSRLKKRLSR